MEKNKKLKTSRPTFSTSGPPFKIRMGIPTMDQLWQSLTAGFDLQTLSNEQYKLYKKWGKALALLSANPFYPSLKSHEITSLSVKFGRKVFESYLENSTPSAARMFWIYGNNRGEIVVLALEPHPEPGEYGRIKLADEPK